jgi:hypothetical protein
MNVAVNDILDLVEARLTLISTNNGYNTTVKTVSRAKLTPLKGYDLPAINYWATDVGNKTDEYGIDTRSVALLVEYHSKTNDSSFIDVANELAADVVTAINRAPSAHAVSDSASFDLGGAVSNLIFNGYDYEIGQGQAPWCGVLVRFSIEYTTNLNDMTTYN